MKKYNKELSLILGHVILILAAIMFALSSCNSQTTIKPNINIGKYSDYQIKKAANAIQLNHVDVYRLLDRPISNSIKEYGKLFKCSERDLKIATTAMAILESGYLKSKSVYVNNLFGIKRSKDRPKFSIKTNEYVNGKKVNIEQSFIVFYSIEDCTNGYYKFLMSDRYKKVRQAKNYKEYLYHIQKCGYATDPKYFDKVYAIAKIIDKNT